MMYHLASPPYLQLDAKYVIIQVVVSLYLATTQTTKGTAHQTSVAVAVSSWNHHSSNLAKDLTISSDHRGPFKPDFIH
jgi:hypothetical protein